MKDIMKTIVRWFLKNHHYDLICEYAWLDRVLDWLEMHYCWREGYYTESCFSSKARGFIYPSIWDNRAYNRLKRAVEKYQPDRDKCLYGWVIFSCRRLWGEKRVKVTSVVLARLAEQGCIFTAYRIGWNKYIIDQINHPDKKFSMKY